MRPPLVHRILLAVLPAFVIGAVVLSAIWGENGLVRRMELTEELREANAELEAVDLENQRMQRELRLLDEDRVTAERAVASELERGVPGTTIYRFHPPETEADAGRP